mmetsp:Transcript_9956/g.60910  ORF Transcript_9956/g.60910 Transcript_9956/m.60910 type:complete len:365 (+) Transcript_9956:1062-2156(+)
MKGVLRHHHEANLGMNQLLKEHSHLCHLLDTSNAETVIHCAVRIQARPDPRNGGCQTTVRWYGFLRGNPADSFHKRWYGVVQTCSRSPRQVLVGGAATDHQNGPSPERLHQRLQCRIRDNSVFEQEVPEEGGSRPQVLSMVQGSLHHHMLARILQFLQQLSIRSHQTDSLQVRLHATTGEERALWHSKGCPLFRCPEPFAELLKRKAMASLGARQMGHGNRVCLPFHQMDPQGSLVAAFNHLGASGEGYDVLVSSFFHSDRQIGSTIRSFGSLLCLQDAHDAVLGDGELDLEARREGRQGVPRTRFVRCGHGNSLLPCPECKMGQVRYGMTQQDASYLCPDVFVPGGRTQEQNLAGHSSAAVRP